MILLIILVGVCIVGGFLTKISNAESYLWTASILSAIFSALGFAICLSIIVSEHSNTDRELEEIAVLREASKHLESYSDGYVKAKTIVKIVELNQKLAVWKIRNQSLWWDWFCSDRWVEADPISIPVGKAPS